MTDTSSPIPSRASRVTATRSQRVRWLPVVVIAVTALVSAACSSSGSATSTTTTTASPSGGLSGSGSDAITIQNFAFSPARLTVAAGATVTVTNKDQVAHTLTATKGGFDTGEIAAGQSKSFTAPNNPGTYPYICSIHQYMSGTLVVSS
jgi:plastocyanin